MKPSRKSQLLKFAHEKFKGLKNYDAAKAAGKNGKRDAVERWAERAIKNSVVQEELDLLNSRHQKKAIATKEEALALLTDHARGSIEDFLEIDEKGNTWFDLGKAKKEGRLHLLEEISFDDPVVIRNADGTSTVRTYVKKLKLHSPQGAVDRMAKMEGWNAPEKRQIDLDLVRIKEKLDVAGMSQADKLEALKVLENEFSAYSEQD